MSVGWEWLAVALAFGFISMFLVGIFKNWSNPFMFAFLLIFVILLVASGAMAASQPDPCRTYVTVWLPTITLDTIREHPCEDIYLSGVVEAPP